MLQRQDGFSGLNTNPDTIRWRHAKDGKFQLEDCIEEIYPHNLVVSLDPGDKYGTLIPHQDQMFHMVGMQKSMSDSRKAEKERFSDCLEVLLLQCKEGNK